MQETLAREINPSVYPSEEFKYKLAEGHHFLKTVLKAPKIFLIGAENELEELARQRLAADHKTSSEEIADLLSVAERDLKDSSASGLSPDWQLAIAYNAALQVATASLFANGYRAGREAHHYRIIQSLAHTIQAKPDLINQLDKFRKKRNIGGYEAAGRISQQEADEMKKLAKDLYGRIVQWLNQNHPSLMAKKQ